MLMQFSSRQRWVNAISVFVSVFVLSEIVFNGSFAGAVATQGFSSQTQGAVPQPAQTALPGQIAFQRECAQVCANVQAKIKLNKKKIQEEYKQWSERLGVKSEVVRLDQGSSATEELLRFMSSYYRRHAPGTQMDSTFLVYLMTKCFPETYVDASRARMTGLVNTIWAAENLKIEDQINTCK